MMSAHILSGSRLTMMTRVGRDKLGHHSDYFSRPNEFTKKGSNHELDLLKQCLESFLLGKLNNNGGTNTVVNQELTVSWPGFVPKSARLQPIPQQVPLFILSM